MLDKSTDTSSFVQTAIDGQLQDLDENKKEKLCFNPLALYFGDDYKVTDKITIHQPTVQDFIDYGEENIYGAIAPFVCNTTGYRVQLWEMGIDWNKITNFQLFAFLLPTIDHDYSKIIFGDLDFSKFELYEKRNNADVQDGGENDSEPSIVLYDSENDIEIDEETKNKMCSYIQHMFHSFPPEEEFVRNKTLKKDLINNDKLKLLQAQKEHRNAPSLLNKISFCLNHSGFKYKKNELRDIGIYEFLDSVSRLSIYEATHALLGGSYSGFIDTSKIDKNMLDFMRDA